MNKQLPDKIKLALAHYYHGRELVSLYEAKEALNKINWYINDTYTYTTKPKPEPWDKDKEWDKVSEVVKKLGFGIYSIGGTFVFTKTPKRLKKSRYVWSVDHRNYLTAIYTLHTDKNS